MRFIKSFQSFGSLSVLLLFAVANQSSAYELSAHYLTDYSHRGISQTKGSPSYRLHASVDSIYERPIYFNIDLYKVYRIEDQDRSSLEVDYTLGIHPKMGENFLLDLGQRWYTYHGHTKKDEHTRSQERSYPEWFLGVHYQGTTRVYAYYTDDLQGVTNARNFTLEVRHSVPLWIDTDIYAGRVASLEPDKKLWDNDERYMYFGLTLSRRFNYWSIALSVEGTSLNARAEPSLKDRGERKFILDLGLHWSQQ